MGNPHAIFWRLLIASALLAAVLEVVKAYVPPGPDSILNTDRTMTVILAVLYFGSYWLWVRRGQGGDVPRGTGALAVMALLVAAGFLALASGLAPRFGWDAQAWAQEGMRGERGWAAVAFATAALAVYQRVTRR